jgi:hypothetical protein
MGGMGAAGAATGALTGEVVEAEPISGPVDLPGNITVVDPDNGAPLNSFVTDANGEINFGLVASAGQTGVVVTVGGESYFVDVAQATGEATLEVAFDNHDFYDISKLPDGYKSTATLTPDFGGLTPTGQVNWTVTALSDYPGPLWQHPSPPSLYGLAWGPTPNPGGGINAVSGTPPNGPTAQLTDVVGERVVRVDVSTTIDGVIVTDSMTVEFGKGPLSQVGAYASPGVILWATAATSSAFASLSGPLDFPFAAFCGGSLPDPSTVVASPGVEAVYGAGWTTEIVNGDLTAYPVGSKMASIEQIQAISSVYPGRGALIAAGWTGGGSDFTGRSIRFDPGLGYFYKFRVWTFDNSVIPAGYLDDYGSIYYLCSR